MRLQKICSRLSLTRTELFLVTIVVAALELFLNLWILRTEYTPEPDVFITYWGFQVEAIKLTNVVYTGIYPDIGLVINIRRFFEFLWQGIAINLLIYVALSIFLVKVIIWARDEIEYRRCYKTA